MSEESIAQDCLDALLFQKTVMSKQFTELRTQLAACQSHNVELREAIYECSAMDMGDDYEIPLYQWDAVIRAVNLTDTESLDAAIAEAVEECAKVCESFGDTLANAAFLAEAIRAKGKL